MLATPIVFLFLTRLIFARSILSYHHPDEWYQTLEFANQWANHIQSFTPEVQFHLRNQTLPWIFSLFIKLSHFLNPTENESPLFRYFLIKAFTAILDCLQILCFYKISTDWFPFLKKTKTILGSYLWFLVLFPALANDSIRTSQEHFSAMAFWFGVYFLAQGKRGLILSGLFLAFCAVFRPASGLFTAGAFFGFILWQFTQKTKSPLQPFLLTLRLTIGIFLGLAAGGIADWVAYSRPYESFLQYLQYNVLTPIGAELFGVQSATIYLQWFKILLPQGLHFFGFIWAALVIALALGFVYQTVKGRREASTSLSRIPARELITSSPTFLVVLLSSLFYLLGHLWIGHKEPRFLNPLFLSASLLFYLPFHTHRHLKTLLLIPCSLVFIVFLWGDRLRLNDRYFEIAKWVKEEPHVCAVITQRRPITFLMLDEFLPQSDAPSPIAFAFFSSPRHHDSKNYYDKNPLVWLGKSRSIPCSDFQNVLIQTQTQSAPDSTCRILSQMPFNIATTLPLSGPWWSCPSSVLTLFKKPEFRDVFAQGFGTIAELARPNLHLDPQTRKAIFLKMTLASNIDPPENQPLPLKDGTFGDMP